jgi:hypothetical protein
VTTQLQLINIIFIISMKQEDYTYWLHLCKASAVVQKLYDTDRAAKLYFVNTRLCEAHDGETEATVRLFGGAVWFQTSGHVNNRFLM